MALAVASSRPRLPPDRRCMVTLPAALGVRRLCPIRVAPPETFASGARDRYERSARLLREADLTQHPRAVGAGGGGDVAGVPEQGLVGQHGEGDRLLRLG